MPLSRLSEADRQVVFESLRAAAVGPFFDDVEFHTLFGLDRKELMEIVSRIPNIDDADPHIELAINNSLINLLGYPIGVKGSSREDWILPSASELEQAYGRWRHSFRPDGAC
jgi:hypothetical protein